MDNKTFFTFGEYMKDNILTISEEDYLEMIYRLCLLEGYTRVNELAQRLNVKPPSVSKMIRRLVDKELIKHVEYGVIQLTAEGKKIGKVLLERHQIVEDFLKLLNINKNLLEETEKIEHTVSPITISKLKQLITFFNQHEEIVVKYNEWIKQDNFID